MKAITTALQHPLPAAGNAPAPRLQQELVRASFPQIPKAISEQQMHQLGHSHECLISMHEPVSSGWLLTALTAMTVLELICRASGMVVSGKHTSTRG